MSTLFIKIYDYGHARKFEELKELVTSADPKELSTVIASKLGSRNIAAVLKNTFDNLSTVEKDLATKYKIIDTVIKELPKHRLTNGQNHAILMRLVVEFDVLPSHNLVTLTDYCIAQLQKDVPDSNSWKELLPKLLTVLKDRPSVLYSGNEIPGYEYKEQVINTLCMSTWHSDNITMIADMFSLVPLNDEESLQVVSKLCQGLASFEPSEVPPLVHQILRVCGDRCCLLLVMHAQQYFESKLNPEGSETGSRSKASSDLISNASIVETRQSEGTVLFHIAEFATLKEKTILQMLKTVKSLSKAPEIIFSGYVLLPSALFMIARQNDSVFQVMSNAALYAIQDEEYRRQSFWVRDLIHTKPQLKSSLEHIIEETPGERGMVLEGIIDWCMLLLEVKRYGKQEEIGKQLATLGCGVLYYLVKNNKDAISLVVQKLSENIMRTKFVDNFVQCFHHVVQMMPRFLFQSQTFISYYMVEQLMNVSGSVAEQVILSLVPLLQLSESLCNSLVIVLTKCLRRPSNELRQTAVAGLLLMMQKLKVKHLRAGFSQSHNTASSCSSSQATDITVHGYNAAPVRNPEAVCLELLQNLRHCLNYQAEVKLKLYQGLQEVSVCNPEISQPALEFLWTHLNTLLDFDDNCPFMLEKTEKESLEEDDVILVEPLGHLVFTVTQILCEVKGSENMMYESIKDVEKDFAGVATKMATATLHHLGFEEDDLALDEGAKGSRKVLHLSVVLDIYEALIAYTVHRWSKDAGQGETYSKALITYHKAYIKVSDYQKSLKRPAKKKADEATQANGSQANPTNPRKRGRTTGGVSAATIAVRGVKEVGGVKVPPVLNLSTMQLLLNLLYNEDVEWASERHASQVKSKLEFQCWTLNTLLNILSHFKSLSINILMDRNSSTFQQLCDVAQILYAKCICRLSDMSDNHPDTAALALECFCFLMHYIRAEHHNLFPIFLVAMSGASDEADPSLIIGQIATKLQDFMQAQLAAAEGENEETLEASARKLPRMLVSALAEIATVLKPDDVQLYQIVKFLQDLVRKQATSDEHVVRGVLDSLITLSGRRSDTSPTMQVILRHLCELTGTVDDEEAPGKHKALALVSDNHINVTVQVMVAKLRETLDYLSLITHRMGYERKMVSYVLDVDKEELRSEIKQKERGLCSHVNSTLELVELLLTSAVPPQYSEIILRLVGHLYIMLTQLCRHFNQFSTKTLVIFRGTNFESVVKNAGKQLYTKVSAFISYIETKNNEKYEAMQGNKNFNVDQAKRRVQRDSDLIAKTVLEMEKFSKTIIQLSNKTKIPLKEHMHLGVSHDFRIDSKALQNVLANANFDDDSEDATGSGEDISRSHEDDRDSNNTEMRDEDDD